MKEKQNQILISSKNSKLRQTATCSLPDPLHYLSSPTVPILLHNIISEFAESQPKLKIYYCNTSFQTTRLPQKHRLLHTRLSG